MLINTFRAVLKFQTGEREEGDTMLFTSRRFKRVMTGFLLLQSLTRSRIWRDSDIGGFLNGLFINYLGRYRTSRACTHKYITPNTPCEVDLAVRSDGTNVLALLLRHFGSMCLRDSSKPPWLHCLQSSAASLNTTRLVCTSLTSIRQ